MQLTPTEDKIVMMFGLAGVPIVLIKRLIVKFL